MRYYLLLILGLSLLMAGGCKKSAPLDPGSVQIKFGVMKKNSKGRYFVAEERNSIDVVPYETRFGFSVKAPGSFSYYAVIHLAGSPQGLGSSLRYVDKSKNIIRSKTRKGRNSIVSHFHLYPKDAVGKERMDIYVNGQLMKTVHYTTRWADLSRNKAYDLASMPVGFKVTTNPTDITRTCMRKGKDYYWCYSLAVTNTTNKPLKMVRFGLPGSMYTDMGKFRSWYSCSSGVIKPGQTVVHKRAKTWRKDRNWSGERKWIYVAQDPEGKYYKGTGSVFINPSN